MTKPDQWKPCVEQEIDSDATGDPTPRLQVGIAGGRLITRNTKLQLENDNFPNESLNATIQLENE